MSGSGLLFERGPPYNPLIRMMIQILHYLKDPKLLELWVYSLLWVLQDLYHQPVDDTNPAVPIIRNIPIVP